MSILKKELQMQLKILQNKIGILGYTFFLISFFYSCNNTVQDKIPISKKGKKLYNKMYKDKEGKVIKSELCNDCDTLSNKYLFTTKYYSQNKLVLVEIKDSKNLNIYCISYDGVDSSLRYQCGYYFFHEYFNSSGITGFDNPYTELKLLLTSKGKENFIKFTENLLLINFGIRSSNNEIENIIFYLTH